MKLHVIHAGMLKLDGGAMFGVVPKTIWSRILPADENNLCELAMRCLLIEDGNRLMLIDNGIGDKQSEKFFNYYFLHGEISIEKSLNKAGFTTDDITDVFLTHLHFDHCGGGVRWKDRERKISEMTFKNATYWSNADQWDWAVNPNPREKPSFLSENILPMRESGQLEMITPDHSYLLKEMDVLFVNGHTERQMLPVIRYRGKTIVFVADLIPTVGHIPLPYLMSYDTRPLLSMQEKSKLLNEAVSNDYILFFEHDPVHECCTVQFTDKGIRQSEIFSLSQIN